MSWRKAQARDLRLGREVRITYITGTDYHGRTFVGRVTRKWRGWNAKVSWSGGDFIISKGYSDFGSYLVEVRDG